jgi:hypothetical protein
VHGLRSILNQRKQSPSIGYRKPPRLRIDFWEFP